MSLAAHLWDSAELRPPCRKERLRSSGKSFGSEVRGEPHPFLTVGRRVRMKSGLFEGRQAIPLRERGNLRLLYPMN